MSWWVYRRDKEGRRELWAIDVDLMSIVFVLGLIVMLYAPRLMSGPSTVASDGKVVLVVGFAFFLLSKLSVLRRRIWVSWGPGMMTKWWGRLYKLGYVLMALGAIMVLAAHGAKC